MAEPVKRPYDSPRRREQAAATRREILDAAERLFLRDGYAATTMAAIAQGGAVALKTVYVAFETKPGLLRALWNHRLRAEDEDRPMGRHPDYLAVLAEPDPERKLRLNARNSRLGKLRIARARRGDPRRRARRPRHRRAVGADQPRVPRQPGGGRALARRRRARCTSTRRGPPTSCGRSTTRTRGSCSCASAAGRPRTYERWSADAACAQLLG